MRPLPESDLDEIVARAAADLAALRGGHVLITGATGFFGTWLVAALLHGSRALELGVRVTALARTPARLREHLAIDARDDLALLAADVRTLEPPAGASFSHVIHAATSTSARLNEDDPREMFDVVVGGTRRVLDVARACGASRVLFTSSGAVYGRQAEDEPRVGEACGRGPDPLDPRSAYAEAKRAAELLCAIEARAGLAVSIARGFAFVGPLLPLDAHFAAGNFLRDALAGATVVVGGDGTPRRSYLYATDLVVWLLAMLVRGAPGRAYNVGAEAELSIAELAAKIARLGGVGVEIRGRAQPGARIERYVPDGRRAREELGLEQHVGLDEALLRTFRWHAARDAAGG